MTSGRPGGNNLWRDLAAVVVQEVADRVRSGQDTARSKMDPSVPTPTTEAPKRSTAGLGTELKRLVTEGVRASTDSIREYQSDRERRKLEAPMRAAQRRASTRKAGAIGLGVMSGMMFTGAGGTVAMDEAEMAAVPLVAGLGAGAGAFSLNRSGRRYQAVADRHAERLGAASAHAVSLHGTSAYAVTLPPTSSLAFEPTKRLISQKAALAELLPDVADIASELGPVAAESERTLGAYAERIVKLERAQAASGGSTSLDAPLARAVAQYEEGVDAHQKLVEAAATVMAELVTPHVPSPAHDSITEAADRLQGLAEGLRQVRHDVPLEPAYPAERTSIDATVAAARPGAPRSRKQRDRRRNLAD